MYNEIEALEKNLTRKPAANPLDTMFDLPTSAKWDDPANGGFQAPAAKNSGDTVVGQVDPNYSGYDDVLKKLEGMKPRDTSLIDLGAMALATGVGLKGGQAGSALKVAGQYGMDRGANYEKRQDEIESMILKLNADRAAKMAAGRKGVKVKGVGGGNADDPTKNRYLGPDGYLHTPTMKRQDGNWAQLETDPVYDKPSAQIRSISTPDGGQYDLLMDKNKATSIGSKNAESKLVKNAKGELVPINTRTVGDRGLPEGFNDTQMALSPASQKKYDDVARRQSQDGYLARYQTAASDLRAASAALGSDGELSPGFLLAAQRFLGMGMDKGRSLTNDEFNKVEGVNTGLVDSLRGKLIGYKEGKVSSDEVRQEYRKLTALLSTNVEQLRNERIGNYNRELKQGLGSEYRDDLAFQGVSGISGKQQLNDVKKVEKLSGELRSDKYKVFDYAEKLPNGTVKHRKVRMGFNPTSGKWDDYKGDE